MTSTRISPLSRTTLRGQERDRCRENLAQMCSFSNNERLGRVRVRVVVVCGTEGALLVLFCLRHRPSSAGPSPGNRSHPPWPGIGKILYTPHVWAFQVRSVISFRKPLRVKFRMSEWGDSRSNLSLRVMGEMGEVWTKCAAVGFVSNRYLASDRPTIRG